ncbi:hypothetical protein CPI83_29365 (plasmid) [Rhodococcus sp. H-CA8f]|uniref:hypothetical protein n=1 Tax=Rhodococcus sp. H-CA8f TaxID=1727214 RepID=UPI000BE2CE5D|nr:hypothetical protein [Rhodococcus sp. H-CA8f]ATI36312.1 hypothetical protein CPI83_29365 [Rhodococcus sp. H-CA8f]
MSENKQRVTSLVANYIVNEGDTDPEGSARISEVAAGLANGGDSAKVREYVERIVRTHASGFTREVRDELSGSDWSDVDWDEVARQLRD